jgi:hypothetical protein
MPKIRQESKLGDGVGALNQSMSLGLIALKIPNSTSEQDVSLKLIELCYPQHDIDSSWSLNDVTAINKDFEKQQLELDDTDEDFYRIGEVLFTMNGIKLKDWRQSEKLNGMKRVLHFLDQIELMETGTLKIAKASELPPQYLSAVCTALADLFKSSGYDDN